MLGETRDGGRYNEQAAYWEALNRIILPDPHCPLSLTMDILLYEMQSAIAFFVPSKHAANPCYLLMSLAYKSRFTPGRQRWPTGFSLSAFAGYSR